MLYLGLSYCLRNKRALKKTRRLPAGFFFQPTFGRLEVALEAEEAAERAVVIDLSKLSP